MTRHLVLFAAVNRILGQNLCFSIRCHRGWLFLNSAMDSSIERAARQPRNNPASTRSMNADAGNHTAARATQPFLACPEIPPFLNTRMPENSDRGAPRAGGSRLV